MAGSHLLAPGAPQDMAHDQGWITSACFSPHLGHMIGLGFLEDGDSRLGQEIIAANPLEGRNVRLRVASAHFIDPEGGRLRD
ncbi:glycine cleavage T C-terminal barrel domain-containing protein [Mangrovicoccus ximenensis]|uniref:glycine cleavage T C-terminal barrel domain-containing protein n=1 Tax=Mangrovicoccus ximenensis TaxID=1911570 RepID=UPI001F3A2A36|nr:glycine cleavage T C-terminal barrel domain-containing protein [Mangrovicoccus ximenensis]